VPAVSLSLSTVPQSQLKSASGLFNLTRNLGGAVGIALVTTWLQDYSRIHALKLSEAMAANPRHAQDALAGLTNLIASHGISDLAQAQLTAQGEIARIIAREATTLAFDDVFKLMALFFVFALVLVPFCRRPAQLPATAEAH
jgi:DHA2 family multidrug resistance protein